MVVCGSISGTVNKWKQETKIPQIQSNPIQSIIMKFTYITSLITLLGVHPTHASHIVSGSTSRLPMSLSSVINDLEAEGASLVTTVTLLSSRGITHSKRSTLLKNLFGITGDGDHDDEALNDSATAFGKKMGVELDEEDEHDGEEEEDGDDGKTGIAVANPLPSASVNEIAATVQACGGNIVYVVASEDLSREEGLFDKLAPALERILNSDDNAENDVENEQKIKNLVVVVEGATTAQDLLDAKAKLENEAASVLSRIVQPDPNNHVTTLQQVFDSVEFVVSSGPVDELLEDINGFCDPADAAANVAKAVFQESSNSQSHTLTALKQSPTDLAAARKLLPLSHQALADCISSVQSKAAGDLVNEFGSLCDAVVKSTMSEFDTKAGATLLKQSRIAKQIRTDLYEQMYSELGTLYEQQLTLLYASSFAMFKSDLSKLRLGPKLASEMERVASDAVSFFVETSKKLRAKKTKTVTWVNADDQVSALKKELKEYITMRLQAARADGKYRPVPRKGVTFGFHWLLPKPFGNDYRQEPWQVHAKDDLVYVPKDKITDVRKEDVLTGDWREKVVPCPTANEMMYLK